MDQLSKNYVAGLIWQFVRQELTEEGIEPILRDLLASVRALYSNRFGKPDRKVLEEFRAQGGCIW